MAFCQPSAQVADALIADYHAPHLVDEHAGYDSEDGGEYEKYPVCISAIPNKLNRLGEGRGREVGRTVWNMEWKYFLAQWNPIYTELNKIVLVDEKMRKASRARSDFEAQVCVFCRYWKESIVKISSAIERANIMLKKTLQLLLDDGLWLSV
jgi:hypothetical protein